MGLVVLTGGTNGLGLEAAHRLAARGHELILTARNIQNAERQATDFRTIYSIKIAIVELDLASLASVRTAAEQIKNLTSDKGRRIDALVCNAGAQWVDVTYSKDSYEETFAINHLAHFLLVMLLLDSMAGSGRVVITSSGTHDPETTDGKAVGAAASPDAVALANTGKDGQALSGGIRYSTSKLCNILFAYELKRRLDAVSSPIACIAFDPGLITETALSREHPWYLVWLSRTWLMYWVAYFIGATMGSLKFSGDSLAGLAIDPAYAEGSGKYFQSNFGVLSAIKSSKTSYEEPAAAKLWKDSETLVKLQENEKPKLLKH